MDYMDLIDRAEGAVQSVDGQDQGGARRVIAIARELESRPREAGVLLAEAGDPQLRRELGRHFELLGRRGAKALPLAALARALLADLSGTRRDFEEAIRDCQQKLLMFGL